MYNMVPAFDSMAGTNSMLRWRGRINVWPADPPGWKGREWQGGSLAGIALIEHPGELRSPLGWTALLWLGLCVISTSSVAFVLVVMIGRRLAARLLMRWFAREKAAAGTRAYVLHITISIAVASIIACVVGIALWFLEMPRPSLMAVPVPVYLTIWWWIKWSVLSWAIASSVLACFWTSKRRHSARSELREEFKLCPDCGYSLAGHARGAACPECGPTPPSNASGFLRKYAAIVLVTVVSAWLLVSVWMMPWQREYMPNMWERPNRSRGGWTNELAGRWHLAEDGVVLLLPTGGHITHTITGDFLQLAITVNPAEAPPSNRVPLRGDLDFAPGPTITMHLTDPQGSHQQALTVQPFLYDVVGLLDSKGQLIQDPQAAKSIRIGCHKAEAWMFAPEVIALFIACDDPECVSFVDTQE